MQTDPNMKRMYTKCMLQDIKALEFMLANNLFEDDVVRIGAEQELVFVDKNWMPAPVYADVLNLANDPQLTTELGRFNLEINLNPQKFTHDALKMMHKELNDKLAIVQAAANECHAKMLLTGILPTLGWEHLRFEWMTPNPRYQFLSEVMSGQRQDNFQLNIKGLDELVASHPNILFEACNTSFQVHLQIKSTDFVMRHNWAQAIAAPVLAAAVNSPILMGKRLWHETRIALFQQSIDLRNTGHQKRDSEPRVSFGSQWMKHSAAHYYQDNVSRFNSLLISEIAEDSMEKLRTGRIPHLSALCTHNSTVYTWNRACYGVSGEGKPHLRIECRYLPSGPTTDDEMANAAFWLGLMMGMPDKFADIHQIMNFEHVRLNFYHAAQMGLDANINWLGKVRKMRDVILTQFLPWAKDGLQQMNINPIDIDYYLGIIEGRVKTNKTGAAWLLKNYQNKLVNSTPQEASIDITKEMYAMQQTQKPVHQWPDVPAKSDATKRFNSVKNIMATDLATVHEDELLEMALNIMVWRNVRYVMVENNRHEPIGLVASRVLVKLLRDGWSEDLLVKNVMITDIIFVKPETSTAEAIELMNEKNIGCLPVVDDGKLVGLITEREIVKVTAITKKFEE